MRSKSIVKVAEFFEHCTEPERKRLSKTTYEIYKLSQRLLWNRTLTEDQKALKKKVFPGTFRNVFALNAQCAMLACCPLSRVKDMELWHWRREFHTAITKTLIDRNPVWLGDWVEHQLDQDTTVLPWNIVQPIIRSGAIGVPSSVGFTSLIANYFIHWVNAFAVNYIPLSTRLIENLDLIEAHIYRFYEIESRAFIPGHNDNRKEKVEGYESIFDAINLLVRDGYINKKRLIEASFNGLSSSLAAHQVARFVRAHEQLALTDDEICDHESKYRQLLGSRTGSAVLLAIKMLYKVEKAKKLDSTAFLHAAPPVFELEVKGPAIKTLKLAKRIEKKQPALRNAVCTLALHALSHRSSDVQELALDLIGTELNPEQKTAARDAYPLLPATSQHRLSNILGQEIQHEDTKPVEAPALDEVFDALSPLSPRLKHRLGLENTDPFARFPDPVNYRITDTSILPNIEKIDALQTVESLIDATSHAVETVESADEIERILDGLSRLCDQQPDDFNVRSASLLKRVIDTKKSESVSGLTMGWGDLARSFRNLLLTWLTGEYHDTQPSWATSPSLPLRLTVQRLKELKRRLYTKNAGPLLAAPTHHQGWIDPVTFVQRLQQLDGGWKATHRFDLTQALLRIAAG